MEKKNRRKFSVEFKAKVVLEALKERNTAEELARKCCTTKYSKY
jgi:transposase